MSAEPVECSGTYHGVMPQDAIRRHHSISSPRLVQSIHSMIESNQPAVNAVNYMMYTIYST
jgi:hypothetical protein